MGKKKCGGTCKSASWKGDKRCDDGNNNCGCGWDGGDCCGKSGDKHQFSYCSKCRCADPSKAQKCPKKCKCSDPKALAKCPGHCGKPNYKGDGYCDVDNNNCGCAFDGGDCCGTSKRGKLQYAYCAGKANCKCLDPAKGGK